MENHTLEASLEEKARKIWINARNIRNIPYFTNLHKNTISRWLKKVRDYKNGSRIIDIVDICEFMNFPLQRIIIFFENDNWEKGKIHGGYIFVASFFYDFFVIIKVVYLTPSYTFDNTEALKENLLVKEVVSLFSTQA